jgi:5-methylcytosine-specific restriction protein A
MPILHPCAWPRCSALLPVNVTHCAVHARTSERQRGSSDHRGYTYQWSLRAQRFKDRYPLCGQRPGDQAPVMSRCFDEGRVTPAFQVDHVIPHRGDPGLFWDEANNWQSLCASCGSLKTRAGL